MAAGDDPYYGYTTAGNERLQEDWRAHGRYLPYAQYYQPEDGSTATERYTPTYRAPEGEREWHESDGHDKDSVEKIYKRIMVQDETKSRELTQQWIDVRDGLQAIYDTVQEKTDTLVPNWISPGATEFLAAGPGAALRSLQDWIDAADGTINLMYNVTGSIMYYQGEMQGIYDRYTKEADGYTATYLQNAEVSSVADLEDIEGLFGSHGVAETYMLELKKIEDKYKHEAQVLEGQMAADYSWIASSIRSEGSTVLKYQGPTDAVAASPGSLALLPPNVGPPPSVSVPPAPAPPNLAQPNLTPVQQVPTPPPGTGPSARPPVPVAPAPPPVTPVPPVAPVPPVPPVAPVAPAPPVAPARPTAPVAPAAPALPATPAVPAGAPALPVAPALPGVPSGLAGAPPAVPARAPAAPPLPPTALRPGARGAPGLQRGVLGAPPNAGAAPRAGALPPPPPAAGRRAPAAPARAVPRDAGRSAAAPRAGALPPPPPGAGRRAPAAPSRAVPQARGGAGGRGGASGRSGGPGGPAGQAAVPPPPAAGRRGAPPPGTAGPAGRGRPGGVADFPTVQPGMTAPVLGGVTADPGLLTGMPAAMLPPVPPGAVRPGTTPPVLAGRPGPAAAGRPGRPDGRGAADRATGRPASAVPGAADELGLAPTEPVAPVIESGPAGPIPVTLAPGEVPGALRGASPAAGGAPLRAGIGAGRPAAVDPALGTRQMASRWEENQQRPSSDSDAAAEVSGERSGQVAADGEAPWTVPTPGGPVVANQPEEAASQRHPPPTLGGATG